MGDDWKLPGSWGPWVAKPVNNIKHQLGIQQLFHRAPMASPAQHSGQKGLTSWRSLRYQRRAQTTALTRVLRTFCLCGLDSLNAGNFWSLTILYLVSKAVLIEEALPVWMTITGRGIFHTPTILQCSVLFVAWRSENPREKWEARGWKGQWRHHSMRMAGTDHLWHISQGRLSYDSW